MASFLLPTSRRMRFVMLFVAGLLGWYVVRSAPLPFVPAWWGPEGAGWQDFWYRRHRMADGLVISGRLEGMTRTEVVALLGEPPDHGYFRRFDLVYPLGAERGLFGIDSEWLAIRLDSAGIVSEERRVRD